MNDSMLNCPKCGSTNKPGRHACWNCWAPLPAVPKAAASAPAPLPRKRKPAENTTPFVFAEREVVVPAREVEAVASWGDDAPAPRLPAPMPVEGPATIAVQASPLWMLVLLAALLALAAAMAIVWRMGFTTPMRGADASRATRGYLLALERGDAVAKRAIIAREATPHELPPWLAVGAASAIGEVRVDGTRASVAVMLPLVVRRGVAEVPADARAAVARTWHMRVPLRYEQGAWRVLEGEFAASVARRVAEAQPTLRLPW